MSLGFCIENQGLVVCLEAEQVLKAKTTKSVGVTKADRKEEGNWMIRK